MVPNHVTHHNYEKVNLLGAYNTVSKFDMICISESYLDSSLSSDSEQLSIEGYKLVRNDYPGSLRRGGACVYFRESLPVRCISNPYLNECLIFKISVN